MLKPNKPMHYAGAANGIKVICIFPPPGSLKFGEGVDGNGKTWRWEFHPWMGPTFTRKDGKFLRNQPGESSPAWAVFEAWLKEQGRD